VIETTVFIILISMLLIGAIILPQYLIYRSVPSVVQILRDQDAVSEANAQSVESLGLGPKAKFRLGFKNYKPKALQMLSRAGIVKVNANSEIYLSEEDFAKSKLGNSV